MNQSTIEQIKFDERGLAPAIVQDASTGRVLMLAYMNPDSVRASIETGYTHFWSRSRRKLWKKGETSGHIQKIRAMYYDCDADTILVSVDQTGPACHTGHTSCFFNFLGPFTDDCMLSGPAGSWHILKDLQAVIQDRKIHPKEGSYTTRLLQGGPEKSREKVLEESAEVAEASRENDRKQIIYEAADLIYHLMVNLAAHDLDFEQVNAEIARRFGKPPKKGAWESQNIPK